MSEEIQERSESTVPAPDDFHHRLDLGDIKLPSIILFQFQTHIEGLEGEPGNLVNSVSCENYGDQLTGFVVDIWKSVREYGGRDDREIIRFSRDAVHWDDDGSKIPSDAFLFRDGQPPEVSLLYHYLIIIDGEMIPAVVTFKGASIKNAKKLNTLLTVTRPYWAKAFIFQSVSTQNDKGRFFVLQAALTDQEPTPTIAKMCNEFYHINRQRRVKSYETDPVTEEDKNVVSD